VRARVASISGMEKDKRTWSRWIWIVILIGVAVFLSQRSQRLQAERLEDMPNRLRDAYRKSPAGQEGVREGLGRVNIFDAKSP